MVDTTTPLLGLLLMGTGGDNNSWGLNLNANVITPIENAIAGSALVSPGAGTYSLAASEALASIIIVQGTTPLTITVPTTSKSWRFYNQTNGIVIVKTAGQAVGVNLPLNKTTDCFMDFANSIVRRTDADRVGELFYHGGTSAPAGALVCNGATPLIASYPDLYAQLGVTWGGNGTTTFGLPNGQDTGRYLRSNSAASAVGTYQANQNLAHTHPGVTFSGTTSGQSVNHSHTGSGTTSGISVAHSHAFSVTSAITGSQGVIAAGGSYPATPYNGNTGTDSVDHSHTYSFTTSGFSADHSHTYSGTTATIPASGGSEARPESLVGLLCVRY
jgi:microcystin-dependent protein